jgi:ADP-heptose:LPS heptosyltransferase
MSVPYHVQVRRFIKNKLEKSLQLFSRKVSTKKIDQNEIKQILIIRINYRIGNMLFTTPLIKELENIFLDAKIDVLVGAPFTKDLFTGFKQVENVFDFDRKLLKNPLKAFRYIQQLRSKKYDVVFNLNNGSTSDRLATLLARSTYKLSFCNDDSYTPTNICVKREDLEILHEALKPLELLKAFSIEPDYNKILTLELSEAEIFEAKEILVELVGKDKKVFGIFRNARYDKKLEDDFWKNLLKELRAKDQDIIFVDILSPDIPNKLEEQIFEYSQKNLRKLAAFMANLDTFICGDTGPMHLASASGVATIALFKTTTPLLYGTLKKEDLSLVLGEKTTEEVADEILTHLEPLKQ